MNKVIGVFCVFRVPPPLLEHGALEVLAEDGAKVEVSGHELLLHILQSPLVLHDLQRLPLALTNKQTTRFGAR